ncbi:MAG: LysM peptidoglycan-binding domain-containing protein, partial [Candidatus Cloacimonetes bacterium]|nr:LysM peptidoglycan-binding domain-containing protein [Candidatus Cloacimonadota bacterium]
KNGDTLSSISSKLNISSDRLIKMNDLSSTMRNGKYIVFIYPGQKLFY